MEISPRRFADTVIVAPEGRVDSASSEAFHAALTPHSNRCAADGDRLVLDLSRLSYISSAGLRVLLLVSKQAKAQGGTFVACSPTPVIAEVFRITQFQKLIEILPTLEQALARVSPSALAAFESA